MKDLQVIGRTSSFYYKDKDIDPRTIGETLGVTYLLEGSVRKSESQVRITAQLIKAVDSYHLFSKNYDRELKDIFGIQDDIAQSVADALQITLGVGELGRAPGMTNNIDAYDAYLAGISMMKKFGRESLSQAIEKLKQAVTLDPNFAIAWRILAAAYQNSNIAIPERVEEFAVKRREAMSRVAELFPETNLALLTAAELSGDLVEVERLYKKALELDPSDYGANTGYGWTLINVGRPTEAIEYFKRTVRLEPLDAMAHVYLGVAYELSGNLDAAAMTLKKGKELTNEPMMFNTGLLVLAMEVNDRALMNEYITINSPSVQEGLKRLNTRNPDQVMQTLLDKPEEAVVELRVFLDDPAYKTFNLRQVIAIWASYFEKYEITLQIYREAGSVFLVWRPIHKGMRQLPGFKDLVREVGLLDYWRTSGKWGEFCRPIGDDDFVCDWFEPGTGSKL